MAGRTCEKESIDGVTDSMGRFSTSWKRARKRGMSDVGCEGRNKVQTVETCFKYECNVVVSVECKANTARERKIYRSTVQDTING